MLDLTTRRGEMAGRVLADLGAEVIKIEPPGGCESRRYPPFDRATGDSLFWEALGLGKRSIVLDLNRGDGRGTLREMASFADVLIESFDPGWLEDVGLGYPSLAGLNPGLIYTSITPYGSDGPKADWPASDLVIEASSGRLSLQGDKDRPPVPIGYPQASFHAGLQAAADIIIALNERRSSGLGQQLDVSMQAAMIWTLMDATGYPTMMGKDPPGSGDDRSTPDARRSPGSGAVQACKDGFVVALLGQAQLERLASLIGSSQEEAAEANELTLARARAFLRASKKRELMVWAWQHDVRLAPVNTVPDLLSDRQLQARGYWTKIAGRTHPGPFARFSRTPIVLDRPAPAAGADQEQLSRYLAPTKARPTTTPHVSRSGEAFEGLKVADFSWVAAGPLVTKALADHGATVVRVESRTRPDLLRTLPPFKDAEPGLNRSHWFANVNSSKLSLTLNLSTEGGRGLARRLADWSDVLVESFAPGTMKRFGLDYETLSTDRSDLIMLSTSLLGQTGPLASYAGYGNQGAAIAGFHAITGWPDRPPCGPSGPYTDVIAPRFALAALAAAVLERRRSGLGQHIDVSQVEASLRLLEPLILDQGVNGVTATAPGQASPTACPNGVYPVAGIERYIAISIETAEQWHELCRIASLDAFTSPSFDSIDTRRRTIADIDAAIAAWTSLETGEALEARLVRGGVPASCVERASDLYKDPQLAHREFFVMLEHNEIGSASYDGLVTHFSAKEVQLHKAAPCIGEDNYFVLHDLLGLTEAEIAAWTEAGAID